VVREGVGGGGRNDPSLVCTYEFKKNKNKREANIYLSLIKGIKKERDISL
jgi:hypothetical protein